MHRWLKSSNWRTKPACKLSKTETPQFPIFFCRVDNSVIKAREITMLFNNAVIGFELSVAGVLRASSSVCAFGTR